MTPEDLGNAGLADVGKKWPKAAGAPREEAAAADRQPGIAGFRPQTPGSTDPEPGEPRMEPVNLHAPVP
jgi:hypothetical protein